MVTRWISSPRSTLAARDCLYGSHLSLMQYLAFVEHHRGQGRCCFPAGGLVLILRIQGVETMKTSFAGVLVLVPLSTAV